MRLIDADELNKVKFHPLPYTHIVPADLLKFQAEAYERGWNDAIDAIIESAETIEERKTGRWIRLDKDNMFFVPHMLKCSVCGNTLDKHGCNAGRGDANYCPNCGAKMEASDETKNT